MNYQQWGEQYLLQAEELHSRLESLRQQLPAATKAEQADLLYRINLMYQIYLEQRHIGHVLLQRGDIP